MRWDNLFFDLENQLVAETDSARRDEDRDRLRQHIATVPLSSRLLVWRRAKTQVRIEVEGVILVGEIDNHGKDWLALTVNQPMVFRGLALLPLASIDAIIVNEPSARISMDETSEDDRSRGGMRISLIDRITFRIVLRDLCRRRKPVTIWSRGAKVSGTIDRVALDHLDLAVHAAASPRRAAKVSEVRVVPLAALGAVFLEMV